MRLLISQLWYSTIYPTRLLARRAFSPDVLKFAVGRANVCYCARGSVHTDYLSTTPLSERQCSEDYLGEPGDCRGRGRSRSREGKFPDRPITNSLPTVYDSMNNLKTCASVYFNTGVWKWKKIVRINHQNRPFCNSVPLPHGQLQVEHLYPTVRSSIQWTPTPASDGGPHQCHYPLGSPLSVVPSYANLPITATAGGTV